MRGFAAAPTATAALALLGLILFVGCGSGGGGASTSSSTATPPVSTAPAAQKPAGGRTPHHSPAASSPKGASSTPPADHDSASGAASFEVKGADNSIQQAGSEAGPTELKAAAAALHAFLDARAAHQWHAACEHLATGLLASFAQASAAAPGGGGAPPRSCPALLAALSAGIPTAALREATVADVGALRVRGGGGFLLYRGAHHTPYFIPMVREGAVWKVAALAPSALG